MREFADVSWAELLRMRRDSSKPWLILPRTPSASADHEVISYAQLWELSTRFAGGLEHAGVAPGSAVLVVCDNSLDNCVAVLGTLLRGAVVVPVAPLGVGQDGSAWDQQVSARASDSGAQLLVIPRSLAPARFASLELEVCEAGALLELGVQRQGAVCAQAKDVALIQYTSGTTAQPRGVVLTHDNILHNVRAIGLAVGAESDDVVGCWLPLFHDMGLIGSLLFATYWGMSLVLLTPRSFIFSPESWLWSISRFGITCSAAPNSAYETCARRIAERKLHGLDLSRWRVAVNGGELVQATTIERFVARFTPYGFAAAAMRAVYGLAENTVAVSFPTLGKSVQIDVVSERAIQHDGIARASSVLGADARRVVGVGRPVVGHELRIVTSDESRVASDRRIGEVQVRGRCTTRGYRGGSDGELFDGSWLRTGDRGYTVDGELFLLGRDKQVIKRAGRCIDAAFLEGAVRSELAMSTRSVAVFGRASADTGTEEIVVLVESPRCSGVEEQKLIEAVLRVTRRVAQVTPQLVRLVPLGSIPRTTSGKVRHGDAARLLGDAGEC